MEKSLLSGISSTSTSLNAITGQAFPTTMDGNPNISQSVTVGNTNVAAGGIVITGINQVNLGESEATKFERCRDSLFVSDPEIDREEILNFKERTEGTCEWILDDKMYQSWLNSDTSQLLWISGGPGRGKTVLSVFLSQELETLAQAKSGHVLYHFQGRQNAEYRTTSAILRTFLYQIFNLRPDLAKHAIGRMGTERRTKHTMESPTSLQTILTDVLADPTLGQVFCLLDGLDEFDGDERELGSLIKFFRSLAESPSKSRRVMPNTFKLLISSREMVHLDNCPRLDLELKVDTMAPDVIRFIDARIKEHPAYTKISQKAWTKFTHTIHQRCNGTFLWAAFVLDEVRLKRTESEIRRVIKNVPPGLEDIYHRILSRIDDNDREEVARLLRWVALTGQALTVLQLAEALYSEDEDKPDDESLQRVEDLVVMSRSLTRVEVNSGERRVFLIHASVREYLCIPAGTKQATDAFRFNYEAAHLEIAHRCIRTLHTTRHGEFLLSQVPEREFFSTDDPAWITYAVADWPLHAVRCGKLAVNLLESFPLFFQDPSPLRDAWWCLMHYNPRFGIGGSLVVTEKQPHLLQVCIFLHIHVLVEELVQRMQPGRDDIDHMGPQGHTALWYATMVLDEKTVQQLLDKGASVVKQCHSEGCPLILAFVFGNFRFAVRFCDKLSETKTQSPVANHGLPPDDVEMLFCYAAWFEDTRLLQLLLDIKMHTDPNTSDALSYAAMRNRHRNILFLLDRGFNPNSEMTDFNGVVSRPLLHASIFLKEDGKDALEALLCHGADVNAALIPTQQTSLHVAAKSNELWMVQKLLDHGADAEALDFRGLRPIDFALLFGDIAVAEMLFEVTGCKPLSWMFFHRRVREWYFSSICDIYNFNTEVLVKFCKRIIQSAPSGMERTPQLEGLLSGQLKMLLVVLNWGPFSSGQAKFAHFLMQYGGRCDSEQETTRIEKLLAPLVRGDVSAAEWDQTYLHGRIAVAAMIFVVAELRAQNGSTAV